jgi:folate-binding protein YgfZ
MGVPPLVADLNPGRCRLRVAGDDRVAFLHGQCTNDIKRLATGGSCYAAFLNAKGKMRGDAHIVCRQDDLLLEASDGLAVALEKFVITEDVTIEDVSATWNAWLIVGETMAAPSDAATFSHPLGTGVLSRTPIPAGMSADEFEAMRVQAGIPKFGVDTDETTIPVEAGLADRAISYDKGCYIGQETIARIKTYGHVNRHLVVFAVDANAVPLPGAAVMSDGKEVGRVTSGAFAITLGKPVVMGYLRREFAQVGARVTIQEHSAEVIKLCGNS